jgi:hypothetical protein
MIKSAQNYPLSSLLDTEARVPARVKHFETPGMGI